MALDVGDAGFEQAAVGVGNYAYAPAGSAWTFSAGSGVAGGSGVTGDHSDFTGGNPDAPEGVQVGFLQANSWIDQTVSGWDAGSYSISFQAAQRSSYGPSNQTVEVRVDDAVVATITPSGTSYQTYTTPSFTVTAGAHSIKLLGLSTSIYDTAFVDSVVVTAVEADPPPVVSAPTPVIVAPASASETTVTGRSTELSVTATVDGDPSNLTYTWWVTSMPLGAFVPQLSDNASATGDHVTATFTSAGEYTFLVIVDNDGSIAASEVTVTVEQTATSITVSAPTPFVFKPDQVQLSASVQDQFGRAIDNPLALHWAIVDGLGSIDETGLYRVSGLSSFVASVRASTGSVSATVPLEIMNTYHGIFTGFEDLTYGTILTNQIPEATFSGDPGFPNRYLSNGSSFSIGMQDDDSSDHPLYIDFTRPVEALQFSYGWRSVQSGSPALDGGQVRVFVNGVLTATVPLADSRFPDHSTVVPNQNITRIEIVNFYASPGLEFGNFWFMYTPISMSSSLSLTARRTGDYQGQAVSNDVERSGDPSKYVILVDDYYTKSGGASGLAGDTADIPNAATGAGDVDLARITLGRLPDDVTKWKFKIVLSDPTAVRLFKSDGTLLYEYGKTDDDVLTLDLFNPSGYLAGLQSGDLDVWVEGVHKATDFDFAILHENGWGDILASNDVHMTIADWTFDGPDGRSIGDVIPIWEQELLNAVQSGEEVAPNWTPGHALYKNVIADLPESLSKRLSVHSSEDPTDGYQDELINYQNLAVSTTFQAVYSTDDPTGGADPLGVLTADQRAAILAMLGVNLVMAPAAEATLELGDGPAPNDKFTRKLKVPGDPSFTLDHLDSIYSDGQTVTLTADIPESNFIAQYVADLVLSDGRVVEGLKVEGAPNRFAFSFPVAALTRTNDDHSTTKVVNYITATLQLTVYPKLDRLDRPLYLTQSVTIAVLPAGQKFQPWQQQAWDALKVNDFVTGDPVKRNAIITKLYVEAFDASIDKIGFNFVDAFGVPLTAFEWAGVAAFASQHAGEAMSLSGSLQSASLVTAPLKYPDATRALNALGQGNMTIFMDIYPQLLAYQVGGVDNTNQIYTDGQTGQFVAITQNARDAWQNISTGITNKNSDTFWEGQNLLALAEQTEILQPVMNLEKPGFWENVTASGRAPIIGVVIPKIPGLNINLAIASPVPGDAATFQAWAPGVNFGNSNARYLFFTNHIVAEWKKWRVKHPERLDVAKVYSGAYD